MYFKAIAVIFLLVALNIQCIFSTYANHLLAPKPHVISFSENTEIKLVAIRRVDGHLASSPKLDFSNTSLLLYAGYLELSANGEPGMSEELKKNIYQWQREFKQHFDTVQLVKEITRFIKPHISPQDLYKQLNSMRDKFSRTKKFPKEKLAPLVPIFNSSQNTSEMIDMLWQEFKTAVSAINEQTPLWLKIYSMILNENKTFKYKLDIELFNNNYLHVITALNNTVNLVENPQKLITDTLHVGNFLKKWYGEAFLFFQTYHTALDLRSIIHTSFLSKLDQGEIYFSINKIVLESMLNNLLGNAIKYMNPEKPLIEISLAFHLDKETRKPELIILFKNTVLIHQEIDPAKHPMTLVNGKKLGFHYVFTTSGTGVGLSENYHSARQFGYKTDIRYAESTVHGTLFVAEIRLPVEDYSQDTDDLILKSA